MNTQYYVNTLKKAGFRITQAREALIDILLVNRHPLTVFELLAALKKRRINVNKTTVYREIEFLKTHKILHEIQFAERSKRYEIASDDHHHHLVCLNCDRVSDVKLSQELAREEQRIEKATGFKILNHSLEFFGICSTCK